MSVGDACSETSACTREPASTNWAWRWPPAPAWLDGAPGSMEEIPAGAWGGARDMLRGESDPGWPVLSRRYVTQRTVRSRAPAGSCGPRVGRVRVERGAGEEG